MFDTDSKVEFESDPIIKSKKEQPEMLSEFDRRFVLLPQFDIETKETKSEMWSGDCRIIKAIPLRMLPTQEAGTFCVEERPRTSLKYYGGMDHVNSAINFFFWAFIITILFQI